MIDLAINLNTGDLLFMPNRDLAVASGDQILRQRVHARLMIERPWALDPTDGALGSTLHTFLRTSSPDSADNLRAAVIEALSPIEEITVDNVDLVVSSGGRSVAITIQYHALDDLGEFTGETDTLIIDANV